MIWITACELVATKANAPATFAKARLSKNYPPYPGSRPTGKALVHRFVTLL
jgi:hypothetical protein